MGVTIAQVKSEILVSEPIIIYRYLRPLQFNEPDQRLEEAPCGGIAFMFSLQQNINLLSYAYSICPDDENFVFKIGRDVARGRFICSDKKTCGAVQFYDRRLSLIDNVFIDPTISPQLHSKMKKIFKHNDSI